MIINDESIECLVYNQEKKQSKYILKNLFITISIRYYKIKKKL